MNLDRYHELLALVVKGDHSVIAELHEIQDAVLAWKEKARAGIQKVEEVVVKEVKKFKKKDEPAEPAPEAEPAAQPEAEA